MDAAPVVLYGMAVDAEYIFHIMPPRMSLCYTEDIRRSSNMESKRQCPGEKEQDTIAEEELKKWIERLNDENIMVEYKKRTQNIERADVDRALKEEGRIKRLVRNSKPLSKFLDDVALFFNLIRDFAANRYTDIPFGAIAGIVGTLVYILTPADMIPDFLPGIGFLDDAGVLAFCLSLVGADIKKYEKWKKAQNKENDREDSCLSNSEAD